MNYQAHRIGGVCATTIVATLLYHNPPWQTATYVAMGISVVGGAVGGLLPDIDHPTSKIGRKVPLISGFINTLFGHRGFTHTILATILFSYMLFLLAGVIPNGFRGYYLPLALGLSVGYVSHLLLDMLTVSGIPLFYPFSNHTFRLARLKSGQDDLLVSILLVGGTVIYLYFFYGM